MTNWQTKKLGDVTTLIKDGTHGTHSDVSMGIPLLSAKDVNNGKVNIADDARIISEDDFNAIHKGYKLQYGDVLLTIVGSLGRVAMVDDYDDSYTFQRSVAILRFGDAVNKKFAYHTLSEGAFQRELLKRESKGAQGGVYLGDISKIKIQIPEKPEQERIVGVLEVWDEYIEKLEQKIALKEQLKKGLMQQLLTGKRRLPGFKKDWQTVKLGNISRIKTGGKDNQNKITDGMYPFFVRSPQIERINSYCFDGEAILVPGEGNIGKIFHYINGKFDYHQRVYGITHFADNVSGRYIYYFFVKNFARQAEKHSVKATVDSLRLPTFSNFIINLPSLDEQVAIVKVLDGLAEEVKLSENKLKKINEQKKYLLKNLITGTIRTPEDLQPGDTSRLERSAL